MSCWRVHVNTTHTRGHSMVPCGTPTMPRHDGRTSYKRLPKYVYKEVKSPNIIDVTLLKSIYNLYCSRNDINVGTIWDYYMYRRIIVSCTTHCIQISVNFESIVRLVFKLRRYKLMVWWDQYDGWKYIQRMKSKSKEFCKQHQAHAYSVEQLTRWIVFVLNSSQLWWCHQTIIPQIFPWMKNVWIWLEVFTQWPR